MEISFIIPFHNEENIVALMLQRVIRFGRTQCWDFEVITVNDRSTDSTKQILDRFAEKYPNIHPVHLEGRKDLGNSMGKALKAGTKEAKGKIVIWTMGDMSDDTKTYKDIVEKINQGYDMVFGSRYMPGGSRGNLNALKAFLSSKGTLLARILFSVPSHDITNAFRGFKKYVFDNLELTANGFDISPEFAIKAHFKGYKLAEVPTVYANREKGVPKFKLWKMTIAYLKIYWELMIKKYLPK